MPNSRWRLQRRVIQGHPAERRDRSRQDGTSCSAKTLPGFCPAVCPASEEAGWHLSDQRLPCGQTGTLDAPFDAWLARNLRASPHSRDFL